MRELIEQISGMSFRAFAEPDGDGFLRFEAVNARGEVVIADSLAALLECAPQVQATRVVPPFQRATLRLVPLAA
jgi:hypothetical protein